MYFANNNGLLQFDGKNWTTYPINNGTNVRSVLYTPDDRIYASTFNNFGYFQKNGMGKFDYISLTDKFKLHLITSNELFNIFQGNKKIFFQSNSAVYQYDGDTIIRIPFNKEIECSGFVHNILFISNAQSGVFMLNGNMFIRVPGSEMLLNKKVCSILSFQDHKVLFVTNFDGVFVFDGSNISPYNTGIDDFLKQNQVFCATTNDKQLVFGTVQRGVAIDNLIDGSKIFINTFTGLQNNTVLSATFDNQQNLWLGLDKGIDYVMLNSPIQNIFGANNLYGAGYTSLLKNNLLYFGTNQGLYFSHYPIVNEPTPLQLQLIKGMEGQIWSLVQIDNTLFCGDDDGAYIIDGTRISRIDGLNGTWTFKKLKSHPDLILGCSYKGLFILKKTDGQWRLSHFLNEKFAESSPMFEEDNDGTIWFSHWQKGIFHLFFDPKMEKITRVDLYDQTKGFPSRSNNTVFRIENEIIFSSERGFYSFNKKMNKMVPNNKWNKLFKTPPSYIRLHESPSGDVWCVSGQFVGLVHKKADNSYSMDSLTYRILQSKIITGFEHFNFIDQNNLILGTEDGFSWIKPQQYTQTNNSFKVFIQSVVVTSNSSSGKMAETLNSVNNAIFKHAQNSVRFQFAAPEFRKDGLVQYSYMLENYDNNWSEFSNDNFKEYTHLPRGNYIFKVRARDTLEPNIVECRYTFIILPAWYETKLAIAIYMIILIVFVIMLIIFVNQRSQAGAKEMEKRKEIELNEQKIKHEAETSEKKREIKELKNQQLQYELRHKSQELATSTMNLIRKNEILLEILESINKATIQLKENPDIDGIITRLGKLERNIKQNVENDNNWKKFEENFDMVYENYLKRLGETYPQLNVSDKRLCAFLKMDLSSKDIASALNMSVRSIEMNRYRLRKKMELDRETNLGDFLQQF
jgi:hypothetical protein